MKFTKTDLTIVTTPFIATLILVVLGYNLLITRTPEARLNPLPETAVNEILEQSSFDKLSPKKELSQNPTFFITTIPQTQSQLDAIITKAKDMNVTGVYLAVPLDLTADGTIKLTNVDQSSQENIVRWAKKTISNLHQQDFYTMIGLTLSSQTTLTDASQFSSLYQPIVTQWAGIASEYQTTFFSTGLTVGHPLYSNLTLENQALLVKTTLASARTQFSGMLGISYCCQAKPPFSFSGFNYLVGIPTPEFQELVLTPQLDTLLQQASGNYSFIYDRDATLIRTPAM